MFGKAEDTTTGGGGGGFTLIEMLIVIAVISILAGVVLTGITGFQASARDTRRIADLKNAQNFLELYFNKCGTYPGSSSCGGADPTSWSALDEVMADAGITQQFPTPAVAAYPYYYEPGADNLSYTIGAQLERDNRVLDESAEGSVGGESCGRTSQIYCIQS